MSVDDILFAPILSSAVEAKIKQLITRIMTAPKSDMLTNRISKEIVDLLSQHGITDEQEVSDIVNRAIKECVQNQSDI
jgi:hypothetical protein